MPYEHKELTAGMRFSGSLPGGNSLSTSGGFVFSGQSLTLISLGFGVEPYLLHEFNRLAE